MKKKNYILGRNRAKKQESSMHENIHYFKCIEFYQLSVGDSFKFKNKCYKKISDEHAKDRKGKKVHFWPSISIYIPKPMQLEELNEKYPLTSYYC